MASHQVKATELLSKYPESYNGWSGYFPDSESTVEKGGVEPSGEPVHSTTDRPALAVHHRVILHQTRRDALLASCENHPREQAKADLTLREKRAPYGKILRRASEIAGLNRDQTSYELQVDPGQLGRWWSGDENPQTWRYTNHSKLGPALLLAQAEAQAGAVVRMSIEMEKRG